MSGFPAAFPDHRFSVVVAVCAHPDDEAFGLGAIISTLVDGGSELRLVCLTLGEGSTLGAGDGLADRRRRELECAARVLGIGSVAVHDYPDGRLAEANVDALADHVVALAGGADVLLTFDHGGITGHPDHQAATDAALRAGGRLSIPVLAWALPERIARVLRREFGGGFVGREEAELDFAMEVDRERQWRAIACHESQSNPVPGRRLDLQGPLEAIRRLP
ncbi:MAG: PIG-L deacetylase family protein [Actinomycetota bacterium]